MTERLAEIKAKCEQYLGYQGESVGMSEVHAVLSFIHDRTIEAIAEIERLEAVAIVCDVARHLGIAEGREDAAKIKIEPTNDLGNDYLTGWHDGVAGFRAAIRAEIK